MGLVPLKGKAFKFYVIRVLFIRAIIAFINSDFKFKTIVLYHISKGVIKFFCCCPFWGFYKCFDIFFE